MTTLFTEIFEKRSKSGILQHYYLEMSNSELNKNKKITASSPELVRLFAESQANECGVKVGELRNKQIEKEEKQRNEVDAKSKTEEAQFLINALRNTLNFTLEVDDKIDWEVLKSYQEFSEKEPNKKTLPLIPDQPFFDPEPLNTDKKYNPKINILDRILKKQNKKIAMSKALFELDHSNWVDKSNSLRLEFEEKLNFYKKQPD
jgi:restriction system protein